MEEILRKINAHGYMVNNLFQVDTNFWRCNIRSPAGTFFDFAQAPTPREALELALASVLKGEKLTPLTDDFSDILG